MNENSLTPLEACRIIKEHDFPLMITTIPPIPSTMNGKTENELWDIIEAALKRLQKYDDEELEYDHANRGVTIEMLVHENHKLIKEHKALEVLKDLIVLVDDSYAASFSSGYGLCIKNVYTYKNISKEQFEALKDILEVNVQGEKVL